MIKLNDISQSTIFLAGSLVGLVAHIFERRRNSGVVQSI